MFFQNFITDSTLIAFRSHELTAWSFSPKIVKSFYPLTIFAKKAPSENFDWVLKTFRLTSSPLQLLSFIITQCALKSICDSRLKYFF